MPTMPTLKTWVRRLSCVYSESFKGSVRWGVEPAQWDRRVGCQGETSSEPSRGGSPLPTTRLDLSALFLSATQREHFHTFQLSLSTELSTLSLDMSALTPLFFPYLQKYKLVLSQPMHRQTEWPIGWCHHCNDQLKSLVVLFLIAHQGPDFWASFRPNKPVLNILALIWVSALIFKCSCAEFLPQTAIMTSGPPLHVPAAQNGHYA